MSVFLFLTVVQLLVATALVVTILMQRSEGGGLGIGGSPNGMMSARGAADFLTRSTKWLAVAFVGLSIALAAVAVKETGSNDITSTVDRGVTADPVAPADPLAGEGDAPAAPAAGAPAEAPAETPAEDPLADLIG